MASRKKGLGKGLDALLGDAFSAAEKKHAIISKPAKAAETKTAQAETPSHLVDNLQRIDTDKSNTSNENRVLQIPVEFCQQGKYQPRRAIDAESLEELASSIKSQGVMQPIIIRELSEKIAGGARYEIIAGERRWRASQLAGLAVVPAIVKNVTDQAASVMALIENLQRDDLNPMDEAFAFSRLQQEFELTHQQIATMVGKSRAAVSNTLRLISLHKEVKLMLENGDIEMGHARALLALDNNKQSSAAREVANRTLSVRQTEALVKNWPPAAKNKQSENSIDPNISRLETELSEQFGVPIMFKHKPSGAGQLTLKYHSLDELDGILAHIKK